LKKALIAAVVVLALGGILTASMTFEGEGDRKKVYATEVERREIVQTVKASGQVNPRTKVNISPHVVAKIEKLYVREGDRIEAGDPFVDLERATLEANRDTQRAQVRMSRTDVQQAEIRQSEAESQLRRIRELLPAGVASPEELENAQLALERAKADRARALQAVKQASAGLEKAEDDLAKTTLYAPLSGVVIALNAEVGEVVVSGTMNNAGSVIGTIADLSEIIAEVDVDETDIVNVDVDDPAVIKVDALPDEELEGKVIELGSSGVRKQGQEVTVFKVKVLLTSPDKRIRPGMSARAHIEVAKHADAVVIPIEAVVKRKKKEDEEGTDTGTGADEGKAKKEDAEEEDELKVVFVVDEDEVARKREVETGLSDDTHVEILAGLEGGEQVVTGPRRVLKKLEDGDSLKPTDPEEEEKKEKESEDEEEGS